MACSMQAKGPPMVSDELSDATPPRALLVQSRLMVGHARQRQKRPAWLPSGCLYTIALSVSDASPPEQVKF